MVITTLNKIIVMIILAIIRAALTLGLKNTDRNTPVCTPSSVGDEMHLADLLTPQTNIQQHHPVCFHNEIM